MNLRNLDWLTSILKYAFVGLIFSSCASLLNRPNTSITIHTSTPASLTVNSDQLTTQSPVKKVLHEMAVLRSIDELKIEANDEGQARVVFVKPKNSFAYLLNFFPSTPYGIDILLGYLIDKKTPKRYTYPKHIYIDFEQKDSTYLDYKPLKKVYQPLKNMFKINPFRSIGFEHGGIEISLERRVNQQFSIQVNAAYLLPKIANNFGFKPIDLEGYEIGFESRHYWKKSAPIGPYVAAELTYLNSDYRVEETFLTENRYYSLVYEDNIAIKKKTTSLNLKIGKHYFMKRMLIDIYAGGGIRWRRISHSDKIDPNSRLWGRNGFGPDLAYANTQEGSFITFSPSLGINIGYLF